MNDAVHGERRPHHCGRHAAFRYTPPGAERRSPAGLLAPGSTPAPRLPGAPEGTVQWRVGRSSPVTVAGAARDFQPASLL